MFLNLELVRSYFKLTSVRFICINLAVLLYTTITWKFNIWWFKFFFLFLNPAAFLFFDLYYLTADTYLRHSIPDFTTYIQNVRRGWIDYFVIEFAFSYTIYDLSPILTAFFDDDTPAFIYFLLLYLLTAFCSLFLFQHLGLYGIFLINLVAIILVLLSLLLVAPQILFDGFCYRIRVGSWCILSPDYKIDFSFFVDAVSFSFMFLTVTIATFVNSYAFAYFRYEPLVERLLVFLNLFVLSMVLLVTANNLIVLFLGWELIGITSFFLINFWVARVGTLKAAFKAFSFNKFSDAMLFVGILLIFSVMHDLDIVTTLTQLHLFSAHYVSVFVFNIPLLDVISFFLLNAAFVKSAQIGAHIWLPDSMEAPVPASALIHSATLVSAGIFLVLRFSKLFEMSTFAYMIIPLVGSFTALVGGFISMYQTDVKRVLAYSTISHCGFLMLISVFFCPEYTILYLYVHGFFKAAVFLCVGSIIRFSKNYQDFRRMGGLYKYLPFECLASFICLLNLGGLPFTYGFFIKHNLFVLFNYTHWVWYIIWVNALLASFTGIFYSYRLFFYVFFDFKKGRKAIYMSANRLFFKSNYYTNSSAAAILSISCLIVTAYAAVFILFNKYTTIFQLFGEFNTLIDYNTKGLVTTDSRLILFNFFVTTINIFFFLYFYILCYMAFHI